MVVIKNKLKHPEFWEHVEKVAAHVRTLPEWMKGSSVNKRPEEYEDMVKVGSGDQYYASEVVQHIRASLQARLEGRNEGGDIEVMRLVDEIVEKESQCDNCNPGWRYERDARRS